jgi:hypothetical protein
MMCFSAVAAAWVLSIKSGDVRPMMAALISTGAVNLVSLDPPMITSDGSDT